MCPAGTRVGDRLHRDATPNGSPTGTSRACSWSSGWHRFRKPRVMTVDAPSGATSHSRAATNARGRSALDAQRHDRLPEHLEALRDRRGVEGQGARVVAALVDRDVGRVAVGAPGARVQPDVCGLVWTSAASPVGSAVSPPRRGRRPAAARRGRATPPRRPTARVVRRSPAPARTGSCIHARSIGSSMIAGVAALECSSHQRTHSWRKPISGPGARSRATCPHGPTSPLRGTSRFARSRKTASTYASAHPETARTGISMSPWLSPTEPWRQ